MQQINLFSKQPVMPSCNAGILYEVVVEVVVASLLATGERTRMLPADAADSECATRLDFLRGPRRTAHWKPRVELEAQLS